MNVWWYIPWTEQKLYYNTNLYVYFIGTLNYYECVEFVMKMVKYFIFMLNLKRMPLYIILVIHCSWGLKVKINT